MEEQLKVNLGCRNDLRPGYVNVDIHIPPLRGLDKSKTGEAIGQFHTIEDDMLNIERHFLPSCVDEVYASHCLEHLSYSDVSNLLYKVWIVLKPGGKLIGVVPDMAGLISTYRTKLQNKEFRDIDVLPLEVFGEISEIRSGTANLVDVAGLHKTVWFKEMAEFFLTRQGFFTIDRMEQRDGVEGSFRMADVSDELYFEARAVK